MVWCLSLRKQRAASCRSARPGCANGKGLRGDPERNEIDGFGIFVFDLGGSPLERAEGLAPKPCEAGAGRVRGLMCACARECYPKGRDARFSGSGSAASKARPRPSRGRAGQLTQRPARGRGGDTEGKGGCPENPRQTQGASRPLVRRAYRGFRMDWGLGLSEVCIHLSDRSQCPSCYSRISVVLSPDNRHEG